MWTPVEVTWREITWTGVETVTTITAAGTPTLIFIFSMGTMKEGGMYTLTVIADMRAVGVDAQAAGGGPVVAAILAVVAMGVEGMAAVAIDDELYNRSDKTDLINL